MYNFRKNALGRVKMVLLTTSMVLSFAGCGGNKSVVESDTAIQSSITMDESNVNALTAGKIGKILVSEGEKVKKDQILVELDTQILMDQKAAAEAAAKQAEAALATVQKGATKEQLQQLEQAVVIAKATYTTAQAGLKDAQTNYDRMKMLYDSEIISQAEFEAVQKGLTAATAGEQQAKAAVVIAESQYAEARNGATAEQIAQASAACDAAKAALSQIEHTIENCTLKSPIDGIVTKINVKTGDNVTAGLPAVVVTDCYHPYITCNLDETELDMVSEGDAAEIRLISSDTVYDGKVALISKSPDFAAKKASTYTEFDIMSYGVKVVFADDVQKIADNLYSGMTVVVDFEVKQ